MLLACSLSSGCLFLVVPEVSRTSEVAVHSDDVRAFRVTTTHSFGTLVGPSGYRDFTELQEVPVVAAKLEPQQDAQLAGLFYLFPLVHYSSYDFEVVLYRPGYETVTVTAWPWWFPLGYCSAQSVDWKKCPDLLAQEKVLKGLLERSSHSLFDAKLLRFAAGEFERLAQTAAATEPGMGTARERWLHLAREYAEGATEWEKNAAEKTGAGTAPVAP
jgi:hypothetical protein